jgi:hypothetical protein
MSDLLSRIVQSVGMVEDGQEPLPPLTAEQVVTAEQLFGTQFPHFLKKLYYEIRNGGFGPGFGLIPLVRTNDLNATNAMIAIELSLQYRLAKNWQNSVLVFSHWGSGIFSCLDLSGSEDPPVYRYEPNMPASWTVNYLGDLPYRGDGLIPEKLTLSEWLTEWLNGNGDSLYRRMNTI